MSKKRMQWRVHTPNLLKEIADCALPENTGVLKSPLNIFQSLLKEVAQRAIELDDPKLNALMCRLTLYDQADPSSPEYDHQAIQRIIEKGSQ